jgi:peptidoglycan hydrolase-like protein with peptidoglycan-binding domain
VTLVLICGAAALLGIVYINQPSKGHESLSVVQQAAPAPPSSQQDFQEPTETASITPPAAPAHEEAIPRIAPPTPLMGGDPSLLNPNFPPDVERVQDRLRSLGFSVIDPRGVWSKSTDSAVRRFRKPLGLRSDWRWDLSTQTALFAQAR